MGPLIKILLTANDLIHDLSVLIYSGTGLMAWAGGAGAKRTDGQADDSPAGGPPSSKKSPKKRMLSVLARFSLVLFVLAGMPRMLTYHSFEWRSAVNSWQAGTLLLKLAVLSFIAGIGTYAWLRAGRKN